MENRQTLIAVACVVVALLAGALIYYQASHASASQPHLQVNLGPPGATPVTPPPDAGPVPGFLAPGAQGSTAMSAAPDAGSVPVTASAPAAPATAALPPGKRHR